MIIQRLVIIITWGGHKHHHEINSLHSVHKQSFLRKFNHTEYLKSEKETKEDLVLLFNRTSNSRASKTSRNYVDQQADILDKETEAKRDGPMVKK